MIKEAAAKLIEKKTLTSEEASASMTDIMLGKATPTQIGAFITGLRFIGETPEIIAGCAEAMHAHAIPIRCDDPCAVDIVGTGGDGAHTFNVSTTAAFVAAGAGITVAKHGSYGVSSRCGSADVLSELGINIRCTPRQMESCLAACGIAFLFAPNLHPAMKHVIGPRRELGIWSIFNILGPLCNPAKVDRGVIGVFKPELVSTLADVCARLKTNHQFIVHGNDGLDELTTTTTTMVTEIRQDRIERYKVHPADFGLPTAKAADIIGGEPTENAAITYAILEGERGPKRDMTLLNAAFAIMASGKVKTPKDGVSLAVESIQSGAAKAKLKALIRWSHGH